MIKILGKCVVATILLVTYSYVIAGNTRLPPPGWSLSSPQSSNNTNHQISSDAIAGNTRLPPPGWSLSSPHSNNDTNHQTSSDAIAGNTGLPPPDQSLSSSQSSNNINHQASSNAIAGNTKLPPPDLSLSSSQSSDYINHEISSGAIEGSTRLPPPNWSLSSPQSGDYTNNQTYSSNPMAALGILGLSSPSWSTGPVSFGGHYDTLLGMIFNTQYVQKIKQSWAIGLLGEYGLNQYRINGTLGHQLWENTQVKLTAEYLSQVLPFDFDSGNINQRVGQAAYGLQFQQNFHDPIFQDVNFGGYYSKAPNMALSNITFLNDGLWYTNARNIAGAQTEGADIGTDLQLLSSTAFGMKIFYDNATYNTEFNTTPNQNVMGLGEAFTLEQILTDRMKLSFSGELRAIYDTYGAALAWAPQFAHRVGLTLSLSAQRFISSNSTPSSDNYGIEISFLGDDKGKSPSYALAGPAALSNISDFVKTPAIYEERVLAIAEQQTTLNAPTLSSITPSSGPFVGANTVIINGSNFLPGVAVMFGNIAATVTLISSTELSVIVPAFTVAKKNFITQPVDVTISNPNGQQTVLKNGYTYTTEFSPTLSSASPNAGVKTGGTPVTLTGTNLTGTTSVTFGGLSAGNVVVVSDTEVTVVTPAYNQDGAVDIILTTPVGTATLHNGYTYGTAPTITSLSPAQGPVTAGNAVTINGANLAGATHVTFGGTSATIVSTTSSSVSVLAPSGSGTVDVVVTTPYGIATASGAYTYVPAPTITSLSSTQGPTAGGSSVIITGTNLQYTSSVKFANAQATIVSTTDTTVTVTTPSGTGTVNVILTTPGGAVTKTNAYTYVPAPTVTSLNRTAGSVGATVVISGTNLSTTTAVTFGGVSATISAKTATTVTVTAPTNSGTVAVAVTTPGGTATRNNAYTYVVITSVSPSTGPTVTINGSGFNVAASPTLTFGGTTVSSYSVNTDGTQITATVPARATSNVSVNVVFSNAAGSTTATNAYTYVPVIFVSSETYNGNLGGYTGANAKCNADSAKPSTGFAATYTYRALLNTNNATTSGISYYRTDGTTLIATANSGNLVGAGSLSAPISTSAAPVWTGATGSICNQGGGPFTSASSSLSTSAGVANSTSSTYWTNNLSVCVNNFSLYCVAQ